MNFLKLYRNWLIIIVIILLVSPLLFFQQRPHLVEALQADSDQNLIAISKLLLEYKSGHGGASPTSLKELVPQDMDGLRRLNHYIYKSANDDTTVAGDIVERYYVLSVVPGVLVSEKPNLWPDASIAVCFDNLTVKRLTPVEFAALAK